MRLDYLELLVVCATFFILGLYFSPVVQTAPTRPPEICHDRQ